MRHYPPTNSFESGIRIKQQDNEHVEPGRNGSWVPYQTQRWRLDEVNQTSLANPGKFERKKQDKVKGKAQYSSLAHEPFTINILDVIKDDDSTLARVKQPLSADHTLLHLIHHNAMVGFHANKYYLATSAVLISTGSHAGEPWTPFNGAAYRPGLSTVVPINETGLPPALAPTDLQMQRAHSLWINSIPFPKMRDNLIIWEDCFDHAAFAKDLIGDMVDPVYFSQPCFPLATRSDSAPAPQKKCAFMQEDRQRWSRLDPTERGLILWGDPHDTESWEVTPGFLMRWGWTLKGCDDVIAASNMWRTKRGEKPILLPYNTR